MVPKKRHQRQERSMRKNHLTVLVAAALAATVAGAAWSQSNEVIDSLLSEQRATLAKTAYLVLSAAGFVGEEEPVEQAFAALQAQPWGFAASGPDDVVKLGAFSYLVMKAFSMRGGIMYSIFPGKRYAAKEFAYRGFAVSNTSPGRVLSGTDVTRILGRVLEALGQSAVEEVTQ
jgi:hypothetical protein